MSTQRRTTNLIPTTGFRVLTCRIREGDDKAVFTNSPLIGWQQTNDPEGDPVDPCRRRRILGEIAKSFPYAKIPKSKNKRLCRVLDCGAL
jgi:hypothetical protein